MIHFLMLFQNSLFFCLKNSASDGHFLIARQIKIGIIF